MSNGDELKEKSCYNFNMLRVNVKFPYKPYGTQMGIMNKVLLSVMNQENGLIESPTGTGKTLALLCSTLAWLNESQKLDQPFVTTRAGLAKLGMESVKADGVNPSNSRADNTGHGLPRIYYGTRTHSQIAQVIRELNKTVYGRSNLKMSILASRDRMCTNDLVRSSKFRNDLCVEMLSAYNGSSNQRAQRQVTDQNNNNTASTSNNNNNINRKSRCKYFKNLEHLSSIFKNGSRASSVWDIEDIFKYGKEQDACPYYGARVLHEFASITFCPYNYILDPIISKTMGIKIDNSILILDEAHNIEDACRESASFNIDTRSIGEIIDILDITKSHHKPDNLRVHEACEEYLALFRCLAKYLEGKANADAREIIPPNRMLSDLEELKLDLANLHNLKENLKILIDPSNQLEQDSESVQAKYSEGGDNGIVNEADATANAKDSKDLDKLLTMYALDHTSSLSGLCFNHYQLILRLINSLEHIYKCSNPQLIASHSRQTVDGTDKNNNNILQAKQAGSSVDREDILNEERLDHSIDFRIVITRQAKSGDQHRVIKKFALVCLNPALTFKDLSSRAWSIIITSGTLSPIDNLINELGCKFPNTFQGPHVISNQQVHAAILSTGPSSRIDLNCCYSNMVRPEFQDELGEIIYDISTRIPEGILCFFPSYERLEALYSRWQKSGIMKKFKKSVYREKKTVSAEEFDLDLRSYLMDATNVNGCGSILFAVFRGRVSEGFDFSNGAARACITVGIPFSNLNDVTTALKKEYNDLRLINQFDQNCSSGSDWYASQAFRALNQALGRCIRHRNDWGAIIMLDSRLKMKTNRDRITKWLKSMIVIQDNYQVGMTSLEGFIKTVNEVDKDGRTSTDSANGIEAAV